MLDLQGNSGVKSTKYTHHCTHFISIFIYTRLKTLGLKQYIQYITFILPFLWLILLLVFTVSKVPHPVKDAIVASYDVRSTKLGFDNSLRIRPYNKVSEGSQ